MTEAKTSPTEAATKAKPEAKTEAKPDVIRYTKARLIEASDAYLGVPAHVAAGAFAEEERETLTLDQANKRVEFWYGRPVKEA